MKKIFTLISMALVAMSVNAQEEETYVAVNDGNMAAEYAAIVGSDNVATNVVNGNSVVKFSTTNVDVEAVSSADPADRQEGGKGGSLIVQGAEGQDAGQRYRMQAGSRQFFRNTETGQMTGQNRIQDPEGFFGGIKRRRQGEEPDCPRAGGIGIIRTGRQGRIVQVHSQERRCLESWHLG